MKTLKYKDQTQWSVDWLNSVADGSITMSQRKLSSIKKWGGGIEVVKDIARKSGVHLLLVEDDKGQVFVAASNKPFTVLC